MPNFSPLLFTTTGEACFLNELDLAPEELSTLTVPVKTSGKP